MSEYDFPISKDDITFYGDTEKERKANEEIFDMSLTIAQKDDEIRELNNNWNKLKDWVKEKDEIRCDDCICLYEVLNKMEEIEDGEID